MSPKPSHYILYSAVLVAVVFFHPSAAAAAPCESLASLSLPNATITMARTVAAGQFSPPAGTDARAGFNNLPAFCRVTATLKPSSDSDIRIEVWLPVTGWNGNFQPAGNGGWGGSINYPDLAEILRDGFATAGAIPAYCRAASSARCASGGESNAWMM